MSITKEVTDIKGRKLKIRFSIGGFDNDIPYIGFILEKKYFFGLFKKEEKVYMCVTTDKPSQVFNYTEGDLNKWVESGLVKLNEKIANEALQEKFDKLNSNK
jgi:hypothetical protein